MKKVIASVLSVMMLLGCGALSVCAEDSQTSGELKIVNYYVDGLPIPSGMSSSGRNVPAATVEIARQIKAEKANLVGVQEDFEYHALLQTGLNLLDATYTNGGTGTGSGVNLFSSYKLYNVGRAEWNDAYGVFDAGSDELTPKGIVYATIELAPGAYVDVYNCHVDAFDDPGSTQAKRSQYAQLKALVDSHSQGHAVIVMGDMNVYFTMESGQVLRDTFIPAGFKETWVECENDGNYNYTYSEVYPKYNVPQWGNWDSAEKIFYRDSDSVKFTAVSNEYRTLKDADGKNLSDHAAEIAVLSYTALTQSDSSDNLRENKFDIGYLIASFFTNLYDTLVRIFKELPNLISGKVSIDFIK